MLVKLQTTDSLIYAELDKTERVTHLAMKNRIPVETCYAILHEIEARHDPDSFRLQRFEYEITNFTYSQEYEKKMYTFGDQRETSHYNVTAPAYQVLMRYRVRIPAGGIMLKEMSFYLLRDKQLVLPNSQGVSLSE